MRNILATSILRRLAGVSWGAVVLALALPGAALWGVWTTERLHALERREIVTVELSSLMGEFVEAEARSGRPPEVMQARVEAYLAAVEASVERLDREGRTVLIAEAVVAGSAPDLTYQVRADVARRMKAIPDARR